MERSLLFTSRMKNHELKTKRAMKDIDNFGAGVKGFVDEVRLQVHLGAMELKHDAGPFLTEVQAASRAAAKDLVKRGKELKTQLKKLRAEHRSR